jgi:FtsP/CotA-like multicopper oxidase with cupredoxin domain
MGGGKPLECRSAMLSRRQAIAGAGLLGATLAASCAGNPARAQKSSAPFRILHARIDRILKSASLLAYDGTIPGPLLRVRQGEELHLRLFNELAEPTSLHWHGVRVLNAMDGVPDLTQTPIEPGASFDYRFRPPDAGTFWYHAHSGDQLERGLHGALIIDEKEAPDVDRDIALVLGMPSPIEPPPEFALVNGAVRPDIAVRPGERLRLRLVNATSARGLVLRLPDHAPWVMAIDGQPAEPFVPREGRLALAPGGRLDLFLDATAPAGAIVPILSGLRDETSIARLVYQTSGEAAPARRPSQPPPLPSNPLPTRIDLRNALRVDMTVGGNGMEGTAAATSLPSAPLFTVGRGRPVSLALRNQSANPRVVHVHGHHFRLLDRLDDGWKPYWLDTLVVAEPIERIAFVADNPGKWLIDCRILERPEGRSTAAWFVVT